jgi:hypothetical protein
MRKLPLFRRFAGGKQGKAQPKDRSGVVKETITAAELLERLRFFEAEKAYGRHV